MTNIYDNTQLINELICAAFAYIHYLCCVLVDITTSMYVLYVMQYNDTMYPT